MLILDRHLGDITITNSRSRCPVSGVPVLPTCALGPFCSIVVSIFVTSRHIRRFNFSVLAPPPQAYECRRLFPPSKRLIPLAECTQQADTITDSRMPDNPRVSSIATTTPHPLFPKPTSNRPAHRGSYRTSGPPHSASKPPRHTPRPATSHHHNLTSASRHSRLRSNLSRRLATPPPHQQRVYNPPKTCQVPSNTDASPSGASSESLVSIITTSPGPPGAG